MGRQQVVCPQVISVSSGLGTDDFNMSQLPLRQGLHVSPQVLVVSDNTSDCPDRKILIHVFASGRLPTLLSNKEKFRTLSLSI